MTGAPVVTIVGTVGADPELRFTPSGQAVANFSVAVADRRLNKQTNEWEDANTTWYRVSAWRMLAENVTESITKGMRVIVTGPLTNREYEKDGDRRWSLEISADEVAPSLKWATAKVSKVAREGGGSTASGPASDPWASAASAPSSGWSDPAPSGGGWNTADEPPF